MLVNKPQRRGGKNNNKKFSSQTYMGWVPKLLKEFQCWGQQKKTRANSGTIIYVAIQKTDSATIYELNNSQILGYKKETQIYFWLDIPVVALIQEHRVNIINSTKWWNYSVDDTWEGGGGLDALGWIVAWQGRQIDMVILSIYGSSCPSKSRGEQEGIPTRDCQQYYGYTYWSVITVTDHSLSRSF